MVDKFLYLLCNSLKIKTLVVVIVVLQAAHAFRSSSIPLLHNYLILVIKFRTNLSNRTLYRAQNRQTFASLHISLDI